LAAAWFAGKVCAADLCSVCGTNLDGQRYLMTDKVSSEAKQVCTNCVVSTQICYMCGMPVVKDFLTLPDGRLLCTRDSATVVQEADEAKRICADVKSSLTVLLARFLTLPGTNITFAMVDRVAMQELFKTPGNGADCPNTMGCIRSRTTQNRAHHDISLLSGLPSASLSATCAHELAHAWMYENLSAKRKAALTKDAAEGFCEFIAYLLMDSRHEEDQMQVIHRNSYTRGQIDLYLEAESRYGINEIVQWVKFGADPELISESLFRVRSRETMALPAWSKAVVPVGEENTPKPLDVLTLTGLLWAPQKPVALINNQPFRAGQEGAVMIGRNEVSIRCLEIRTNSVVIKSAGANDTQELVLKNQ
jgi:hypothetical protein